jgi:biopolymer transport protein ExbB
MRFICLLCFLIGLLQSTISVAADINTVEAELLKEIKHAKQNYQQQYKSITKQRKELLTKLAKYESALKSLSVEAKLITRVKDEQNLSVEKLETRLQSWQQQENYLNHLLSGIDSFQPINSLEQLKERIEAQAKVTSFMPIDVALENGQLISGKKISFGPVHVFVNNDHSLAGLIKLVDTQWQLALVYDAKQLAQLQQIMTKNQGILAVDATNNRSLVLKQHQESIGQHLNKGGIWVLPILGFALLALTIAVVKAISLLRLPKLNASLIAPLQLGRYQKRLFDIAKRYQKQERDDMLFNELQQIKRSIERGLSAIAVTAAVAPLLGLLGTVSGMIKTFKLMTLFGAGDANAVSGGISESLVTTEVGLIVAIPALVAHAIMSRKCHHYMANLESYAVKLSHQDSSIQEAPHSTEKPLSKSNSVHEVTNVA